MSKPNTCARCHVVMPLHRVCNLCTECMEEWLNGHDGGDDDDDQDDFCGECGKPLGYDGTCNECDRAEL